MWTLLRNVCYRICSNYRSSIVVIKDGVLTEAGPIIRTKTVACASAVVFSDMFVCTVSAGGNKQHSATRDTAKLDRETDELRRTLNLS